MEFSKKVRTFDAFPKVDAQHQVRSTRGGFSTLLTILCGLLIFWVEVGGYVGGYVDHQFSVDKNLNSQLTINLDLIVNMPCEFVHTNVMDITDDKFLAGELLNYAGIHWFLPLGFNINNVNDKHSTPDLDEIMQESFRAEYLSQGLKVDEGAPACHIFGSIPVNQVKGDFHITAKGLGYRDRHHVSKEALNFSHVINEFSFGEFYPFIDNPLDQTGKVTDEKFIAYKYYTQVVPTEYQRLGITIDTNQYSLTESHIVYPTSHNGNPTGVPGIFFKYDFEPIKLKIIEKRIPFFQFVARLATILGGIMVLAGYAYRLYEKLLSILFGKKYVNRDTEKLSGGLLDSERKKKEGEKEDGRTY
ncbi:ER-derived vesicles protein Erv41p [[Candida] railenensis]|uniref:Endoplasmic reticulum-Golgi intermediate compartment protein n=1 Tax=[Candida] railenensis TaxID=45579 RepID=A0A9P0QVF7_9ASCO|nr:ER-derived vesicles protein Erv41p [[Candida] railenensis]